MNAARFITMVVLMGMLALATGCNKKSPNVLSQQSQAPTLEPEIAVGPPPPIEDEPPSQTQISTGQPPLPELPETKAAVPRRGRATRKPTQPTLPPVTAKKEPDKPVQSNVPQGQLTASVTQNEALHQKLSTTQLIDSTESALKGINRNLSSDEQSMVQHIRNFIQQSRSASNDGDLERAYNLAVKAHLLSDELTKR